MTPLPPTYAAHTSPVSRTDVGVLCRVGMTLRAVGTSKSQLGTHVQKVLVVSAKEQVGGVHATRVVPSGAIVADLYSTGDRPINQLPSDTMGQESRTGISALTQLSVAVGIDTASPKPTGVSLVDLGPKAVSKRNHAFAASGMSRQKAERLPLDMPKLRSGLSSNLRRLPTPTLTSVHGLPRIGDTVSVPHNDTEFYAV